MSTFPPLANRTPVLVRDPRNGDYAATVLRCGLFDTSPVLVAVVDPLDTRLVRGQHVIVPRGDVYSLHRSRWAR